MSRDAISAVLLESLTQQPFTLDPAITKHDPLGQGIKVTFDSDIYYIYKFNIYYLKHGYHVYQLAPSLLQTPMMAARIFRTLDLLVFETSAPKFNDLSMRMCMSEGKFASCRVAGKNESFARFQKISL